jgi:hypothetical protein
MTAEQPTPDDLPTPDGEFLYPQCPEHGEDAIVESKDPDGEPTGDYVCGQCGRMWLRGHGYDGDSDD